jgi:hypothetical protein
MRRVIGALALVVLLVGVASSAGFETYRGQVAAGNTYTKLKNSSVLGGYAYWCWTNAPVGIGRSGGGYNDTGGNAVNARRWQLHHRMIVGGSLVPVARIDILHTNAAATDSLWIKVLNGAVADSFLWMSASVNQVSFPMIADSVAFKPMVLSAAGDWTITTYFER